MICGDAAQVASELKSVRPLRPRCVVYELCGAASQRLPAGALGVNVNRLINRAPGHVNSHVEPGNRGWIDHLEIEIVKGVPNANLVYQIRSWRSGHREYQILRPLCLTDTPHEINYVSLTSAGLNVPEQRASGLYRPVLIDLVVETMPAKLEKKVSSSRCRSPLSSAQSRYQKELA
jgi:hypothetical protein